MREGQKCGLGIEGVCLRKPGGAEALVGVRDEAYQGGTSGQQQIQSEEI